MMEETQIKENGENDYLKTEIAQEVCARPENSDTSESSEKQIQGEEGFVEEPCSISVGKDTVIESCQEAHAGEPLIETHMELESVESGNNLIDDQISKTNEATEIIKNGTLIEEIQVQVFTVNGSCGDLRSDNADKKTDMLITRQEEVSKIILEEMNKETAVSTETREIVLTKNEEGLYMNIHENPTNSTPCEAEPTRKYAWHGKTKISATEDARDLDNLSEAGDIPDKEENAREHEGEHIETQAISCGRRIDHVKNDFEANILKEVVKKHEEFNIQERSCESQDTQIQIPQHEETQVVLDAEQETIEESVTARTGNNNTSESFVEDQSQMKTHIKQEAKVCESETTESSNSGEFAKPEPEGLSADQPSATETIRRIPQNFERISEASDTKNREERSREVDLGKAAEVNTTTLVDDQSRSTEEKNNLEERETKRYFEKLMGNQKKQSVETVQLEKDAKEEEKYSADQEDELVKEDSTHKKSHNILSGVGSKVKHSIAKVKKVITGKSSSHKSSSPKKENESAVTD
ncbi:hypothetical protein MKW92_025185 [Papaver armeniacum]|nr:hypothetical protein MKW92_025185 [Papaver armeniacum]